MAQPRFVVLNGTRPRDETIERMLAVLVEEIERKGAEVQVIAPRDMRLNYCKGCFGCWVETPGRCVEDDACPQILDAVARCDELILFTPVSFGGYASGLKLLVDHFIAFTLPYFGTYHGETHHHPRYERFPRFVGVGVLPEASDESARIFRTLVGRNALNFHAPSHASEVVVRSDPPESLRERFRALLSRHDELPLGEAITSLLPRPGPDVAGAFESGGRRALLVIGSPKAKKPSTSGVLGNYVLRRLEERGWRTESLTLRARTFDAQHLPALFSAVNQADLVVLAFPLYIDALPYLVTRAFEQISAQRRSTPPTRPQRFVAIANNGFPEAFQNTAALAICRRFAAEGRFAWAGALAMGAGEALSSGRSLSARPEGGRPPVGHVMKALDIASEALADGRSVPEKAVRLIAENPIPFVPLAAWKWLFVRGGHLRWRRDAASHGVTPEGMLARPYQGARA